MDQYKEKLDKGETIDFFVKKNTLLIPTVVFAVVAIAALIKGLPAKNFVLLVISIFLGGCAFFFGCTLMHVVPKVLSIHKDWLGIYDLTLSGKNSPCLSIPWNEITHISLETITIKGHARELLILECLPPTLEKIKQHHSKYKGLLNTYVIDNNRILLSEIDGLAECGALCQTQYEAANAR